MGRNNQRLKGQMMIGRGTIISVSGLPCGRCILVDQLYLVMWRYKVRANFVVGLLLLPRMF